MKKSAAFWRTIPAGCCGLRAVLENSKPLGHMTAFGDREPPEHASNIPTNLLVVHVSALQLVSASLMASCHLEFLSKQVIV